MPRFDVYRNPDEQESTLTPFYMDVQSDHIQGLDTRIVVPLISAALFKQKTEDLHPEFEVESQLVVMVTPGLGSIPQSLLRRPVANFSSKQLIIQNALDALFGSY
jgi:toxin CcdB